jgi:glutamine amidotransferase
MTVIIDYGVGNLFSLSSSLRFLGAQTAVTSDPAVIAAADRILLPGVGAFGDAMAKLEATGVIPVLNGQVALGKPLLGICLGMQMLFAESLEYGHHKGLGYLPGCVCPLSEDLRGTALKVPHMGWNALDLVQPAHPLMKYTHAGDCVYFVHSYYAKDCDDSLIATAEYGVTVPAAVGSRCVMGTQFHPEKSGEVGLKNLRAFLEL